MKDAIPYMSQFRRLLVICTAGSLIGIGVILLNPENSKILCLALLGAIVVAWLGLLMLTWPVKLLRYVLFIPAVLLATLLLLPGKVDGRTLREAYVTKMISYEGTPYHWGGESSRGIDCSGLPRRALRDALLSQGLRHFDGSALRTHLEHWWYDASARALSEGYREYTIPLHKAGTIKELDTSSLSAGDLAITADGMHMLAYRGDGAWIQADPNTGAVISLNGKTDSNFWFTAPVTLHRWRVFQSQPSLPKPALP